MSKKKMLLQIITHHRQNPLDFIQTCGFAASYKVALELAKSKKPFSDGSLVRKCAIEMAKAFGDSGMAEKFETVYLSYQTVARRVAHMDEHVRSRLCNVIEKSVYFSLCLDDSADQTDVSQLLIFVRAIQSDFFNALGIAEFSFTLCYHKGIRHF
jgi:hypothetical protein